MSSTYNCILSWAVKSLPYSNPPSKAPRSLIITKTSLKRKQVPSSSQHPHPLASDMTSLVGEDSAHDLIQKLVVNDPFEEKVMPSEGKGKPDKVEEEGLKKELLPTEPEENLAEIEPKTGVKFTLKLSDGLRLSSVGLRKKYVLGIGIKVYSFGIYADNVGLKEVLKSKIGKAPEKPTKDLYEAVIDCDVRMTVRLVIVFGGITMSMVRKNFDETLNVSLKKLNGGQKNEELVNRLMGDAKDGIKLPAGSVIEISRFPGFVLQSKVKGETLSSVKSELLCKAYMHLYLGEEPFDKEAKDRVGASLLTLF